MDEEKGAVEEAREVREEEEESDQLEEMQRALAMVTEEESLLNDQGAQGEQHGAQPSQPMAAALEFRRQMETRYGRDLTEALQIYGRSSALSPDATWQQILQAADGISKDLQQQEEWRRRQMAGIIRQHGSVSNYLNYLKSLQDEVERTSALVAGRLKPK